jgi:hypothetical protein
MVSVRAPNVNEGQSVATDRDGKFQVNELDQGASYYVTAQIPAYITPQREQATPQSPPTYHAGDSVTLTLTKGGVITGTVTNALGEPMVQMHVRLERIMRDRNGRRLPGGTWGDRQTDDRGVYRIYGLPPGTYVVMAGGSTSYYSSSMIDPYDTDVPTYANSATRETATEINVRAGEEVSGVDIRYRAEQGRTISGVVTGIGRGFNVMLSTAGDVIAPWNATAYKQSDDNSFSFLGVAEGDYDLYAYSYGDNREVGVSEVKRIRLRGADATGIELATRELASVAGRVVFEETTPPECTEKPRASFAEMTVGAWHNDTEQAKETPQALWSLGVPVKPDAQGNFLMRNLAPGEYYFAARNTGKNWYVRSLQFPATNPAKKPIDATRVWTSLKVGDKVSGLAITLAQGGASFRGQLAVAEGEKVPARTFVYLAPVERERVDNVLNYFGGQLDAEGKIGMNNIAPGRYWVFVETLSEDVPVVLPRVRLPSESELRAQIRRAAEATKTEIEFKPCQEVLNFKLSFKDSQ